MRTVGWCFVVALLAGCGSARANVRSDEVNGVKLNDANFAIFAQEVVVADIDRDGQQDDSQASLFLAISDREDLCAIIDSATEQPDITLVQIVVQRIRLNSTTSFESGEDIVGVGSLFDEQGDFIDGAATILSTGVVRVGGVTQAFALSGGAGTLKINDLSATFSGKLDDQFLVDTSGGAPVDITAELSANINEAQFCPGLR